MHYGITSFMHKLKTEIVVNTLPDFEITYDSRILSIGSCFAQNMGDMLKERKFNIVANPFGTVYNAVSMQKILDTIAKQKQFDPDLFVLNQDVWHHYHMHSL